MQVFPSPPTDNLYKFMAIIGSWLMTLVMASFMFMEYINYDIKRQSTDQDNYRDSLKTIRNIEKREKSITNGNLEENILSWTFASDGSERETEFLSEVKTRNQDQVSKFEKDKKTDYNQWFNIIDETDAKLLIFLVTAIGSLCLYFGFLQWYKKVQKYDDKSLLLEVKIKELTIKKLEHELALTKKASFNRIRPARKY